MRRRTTRRVPSGPQTPPPPNPSRRWLLRLSFSGQFGQPPFQEPPFRAVAGEPDRPQERLPCLVQTPQPAQQLRPRRVQVAEVVQTEFLDDAQPGLRTF